MRRNRRLAIGSKQKQNLTPPIAYCLLPIASLLHNRQLTIRFQCLLVVLLTLVALLSSGCSSHASAPTRQLTAEEETGLNIYRANCAICHNAYKNEPLQGPPLVGVFRKKELPSGIPATDQHVRQTVLLGRRNMPPFNQVLDDKQVNGLLAFLHTL